MNATKRYWICQIIGWGGWMLLQLFIVYQFAPDVYLKPELKRNLLFVSLFIDFLCAIGTTHLLRLALKKIKWLNFTPEKTFLMFIVGAIVTSLVLFYSSEIISKIPPQTLAKYEINERREKAETLEKDYKVVGTDYYLYNKNGTVDSVKYNVALKIKKNTGWYRDVNNIWKFEEQRRGRAFGGILTTIILVALWLLIYIVWHFVAKTRNDQLDKLKLEGMVKSLELKTIKSHINPHFIFNALNSIRALVDENPQRARTAITELSNILRSSLKAETLETVPMKQELEIVRDYLALEQMRFEERLHIEMKINEDTLTQPIPPMMLQTLVENAIKHGISKIEKGGIVKITSQFNNNMHEVIVENTGSMDKATTYANFGFGIKSTQDRLNLLYHNRAKFEIDNIKGNMVQSKITMPITQL